MPLAVGVYFPALYAAAAERTFVVVLPSSHAAAVDVPLDELPYALVVVAVTSAAVKSAG